MIDVLRKVQRGLRPGGQLLITQPADEVIHVTVEHAGQVLFADDLVETNFGYSLRATKIAIQHVIDEDRFQRLAQAIIPTAPDQFLRDDWASVDVWEAHTLSTSIDAEAVTELGGRIRVAVGDQPYVLHEFYKEEHLLLST